MSDATLSVTGYRELLKAADRAGKESKTEVRGTFRKVGDIVKVDAARRFAAIDARSAAGYRTAVRARGVAVEQRLRRTTGLRPDFGKLQHRKALDPALDAKQGEVVREFENALDTVADHFDNG